MRDRQDILYESARCAGGLTMPEMIRGRVDWRGRWHDDETDMWLPNGVLLFRPRLTEVEAAERMARDILELSQ